MKQIITKDKRVVCVTTVPYSKEEIKAMKMAVYKVKEVEDETPTENLKVDNK
jgi:predicted fused transcriptional regulator/phosphomethylpyrimidine kinase